MGITTITTSAPDDARLVVAFGTFLRLGRNATQPEIVAAVRVWMTNVVAEQERIAAVAALNPASPITPT